MKISTLLLLLILANAAISQINKGQLLVGGNISFESINNDGDGISVANYHTTNFFLSPNFGYFIIPKFAGGMRLNLSIYDQKIPVSLIESNISISPFLRYYLLPRKQKFNVLVDVSYIHLKFKSEVQNSQSYPEKTNGYDISVGPSIFLNEHVAVEFLIGYKQTSVKDAGANTETTFNTGLGLQIHLGKIKTKGKA